MSLYLCYSGNFYNFIILSGFIYSSEEDSDRELDDNYRMGDASPHRVSTSAS